MYALTHASKVVTRLQFPCYEAEVIQLKRRSYTISQSCNTQLQNRIMALASNTSSRKIPVLLLKTRSLPVDTYEELFNAAPSTPTDIASFTYKPEFIPVLEHTQDGASLSQLSELLRTGQLKRKHGGMIFTSQRAVEAWIDIVHKVEAEAAPQISRRHEDDAFSDLDSLTPFPLYVVGPATERALQTIITESESQSRSHSQPPSLFTRLNPSIHGAHTGNGASLASFMLTHYNALHEEHYFTYYEAPRLPFIPLLGMSSQNYGRKRLERDDPRLVKRPLLFLVGEVRRDIIPRTLMGETDPNRRIAVEEMEVYSTQVMGGFKGEFLRFCEGLDREDGGSHRIGCRVVVVFSPQGSDVMLRGIGYLDENGQVTERARRRWWEGGDRGGGSTEDEQPRWIITTIGPTTRDYLRDTFGVEPDVCAAKPSPQGLKDGIEEFLRRIDVRLR